MKYIISYGGGTGPYVWDAEIAVEAKDIRQALDIAEPKVKSADAVIFSIEQEN